MRDKNKSKKQLIDELVALRQRISKMEEMLKEFEERHINIVELALDGIVTTNLKGVVTWCNDALLNKTGFSREDFVNKHFSKLPTVRARDIPQYVKVINSLVRGKAPKPFEYKWIHKDGSIHIGELYISRMKKKGKTVGFQAITRDITEHKRMENELRESEEKYRTVVERANDGIAIIQDNVFKFANPRLVEISGYSEEELLEKSFTDFVPLKERPNIVDRYKRCIAGKDVPSKYESKVETKKEGERFVEFNASIITYKGSPADLVIVRDVTDRKKAEEELKSRVQEIRMIADNVPGVFSYVDKDGYYRFINKKYENWFKIPRRDIIGKHCRHILGEATYNLIEDHVKLALSGQSVRYEKELPYVHGGTRWVSAEYVPDLDNLGNVKGFYALVVDITDWKRTEQEMDRLQDQLIQSEKMAGIGTLASGIAHEFNNLLQIMRGHSEFALRRMKAKDMEEALNIVLNTSDKASKIIEDLRTFSKEESPKKEFCDMAEPIEEVLSLTEGQLKKNNIEVVKKFGKTPRVEIDRGEMRQVLLNMINNAWDAMMPRGGRLEIKLKKAKGYLEICINDTGKGIREEDLNKVFDPFFTTKEIEVGNKEIRGTGLGLSVSYGIVKRHGGEIDVQSKSGKGSTFTIKLPIK